MKQKITDQIIIVAVICTLFFAFLGSARLWDRDEARNATCAKEMFLRGDVIVPTFNGELRAHKPALLYWIMMIMYSIFGVSEFSARAGSALLGLWTCLVTYHLGRRLIAGSGGFWSALVLATMILFAVSARSATPDAALVFFSTLGLAAFAWGYFSHPRPLFGIGRTEKVVAGCSGAYENCRSSPPARVPWRYALLAYTALGLAVLAKGPVGVILPVAVMGLFLLVEFQRPITGETRFETGTWQKILGWGVAFAKLFSPKSAWQAVRWMRLGPGLLLTAAVALPWYVLVNIRTDGAFLEEFILRHHLQRALTPLEGHHGPLFYYPLALLIGTFPWSILLVPCGLFWYQVSKEDPSRRPVVNFLLIWIFVYLVIFTLAQTKLPSYVLPAYPAAALFVGNFLSHLAARNQCASRGWLWAALGVLALVGLVLGGILPVVAHRFFRGEWWVGILGVVLLAGALVAGLWARKGSWGQVPAVLLATAWAFLVLTLGILPARVSQYRWLETLLERCQKMGPPPVAALEFCEPSWVYYLGRNIPMLRRTEQARIAKTLEEGILVVRERTYEELASQLPPHRAVVCGPRFLREEKILLLAAPKKADSLALLAELPPAGPSRSDTLR